jgi:molybdopterin-guanine dinucleotide biosynthesis protein A
MKKIILTGGTSHRFGSNKSEAEINGRSLLDILTSELDDLIIVGPKTNIDAIYVREEPIGGGPVAAIGAAMNVVDTELVAIFATDMPFAPKILEKLEQSLVDDAALPVDSEGFVQPLAALYKSNQLRSALCSLGALENRSLKELVAILKINQVPLVETELLLDIDTQADLFKAIDLASRLAQ